MHGEKTYFREVCYHFKELFTRVRGREVGSLALLYMLFQFTVVNLGTTTCLAFTVASLYDNPNYPVRENEDTNLKLRSAIFVLSVIYCFAVPILFNYYSLVVDCVRRWNDDLGLKEKLMVPVIIVLSPLNLHYLFIPLCHGWGWNRNRAR